jgi:hypothetical protein
MTPGYLIQLQAQGLMDEKSAANAALEPVFAAMAKPGPVSQVKAFKKLFPVNARPLQDLHDRVVEAATEE